MVYEPCGCVEPRAVCQQTDAPERTVILTSFAGLRQGRITRDAGGNLLGERPLSPKPGGKSCTGLGWPVLQDVNTGSQPNNC